MSAFPLPVASPVALGPSLAKTRAALSADCRAAHEMLAFSARWLGALPLPPQLGLHLAGVEGVVRVDLGNRADAFAAGEVVFSKSEWEALCRGIEADRIWPADLVNLCARKAANPAHRLELEDALAGVQVDKNECWSLSRVLERVDAHLVTV